MTGEVAGLLQQATGLHRDGRLDDALMVYARVLTADPRFAVVHHLLSHLFHAKGEAEEAVRWATSALSIDPALAKTRHHLIGLCLTRPPPPPSSIDAAVPHLSIAPARLQRVQIEVTTYCNLRCAACPRTIAWQRSAWTNRHMDVDAFRAVIDHLPPSLAICLQGVGESTMHPALDELVRIARGAGKFGHITLNTNALVRPAAYYQGLRDAGLTHLSVSVDSLSPEVAEACRAGTDVDKLQRRIAEILPLFPGMTISIVLSRRNLADVEQTLAKLNAIGRMEVEIQPMIVFDADDGAQGSQGYALRPENVATFRRRLARGLRRYPNLAISAAAMLGTGGPRCNRPFFSPYVTVEGYLTPCCTVEDPSILGFTSVLDQPFAQAWRTPPVQAWIGRYVRETPDICEGCCFNPGS